jgi:hypothetical protein
VTITNVLVYVALIGFLVARRIQGRPVESTKKLFILPVVLAFIGWQDISHATLNSVDIAVVVAGSAVSLGLGALRGATNKVSVRDGLPWVRWGGASVAVFAVNLVTKLILDVGGVAAGGTTAGVTSSLLLAVGLMMLGEAAVIWFRVQSSLPTTTGAPSAGRYPRP